MVINDNINEKLLEEIVRTSKIHPSKIFNVYIFGSRVYKTNTDDSDWDIMLIANNSVPNTEIKHPLYNIHILTPDKFQEDLDWHRPNSLECFFAPDWAKLQEKRKFNFQLNASKLRHSISHTNSNSWVKSKKKLLQNDYSLGIKSLFHAIRIPMFGFQIIKNNKIENFECANFIWEELSSKNWNWEELDKKYRELNNKTMTEFRKICIK